MIRLFFEYEKFSKRIEPVLRENGNDNAFPIFRIIEVDFIFLLSG